MFTNPALTAQVASDRRLAATEFAARRRAARRAVTADHFAGVAAEIGERVAAAGLDASAADVADVVRLARSHGVGTGLAAIVADVTQPAVARERALGRLLAELAADRRPSARATRSAA